jgi:hypothetical protein
MQNAVDHSGSKMNAAGIRRSLRAPAGGDEKPLRV